MPSEQLIPCPVCDSPAEQAGDAVGCSECFLGWRHYPHNMAEQWNRRPREERLEAERDAALRRAEEAEARLGEVEDKALRFDLDRAGIERREGEAAELVELRARLGEGERLLRFLRPAAEAAARRECDQVEGCTYGRCAAAPAAPPEPPSARWVPVSEALPPFDLPVLLWGSELESGRDHPLAGRLCGCHESWLIEDYTTGYVDAEREHRGSEPEADQAEYVARMLGKVTHWLDWRPGPSAPRPEPETGGDAMEEVRRAALELGIVASRAAAPPEEP